MLRKLTTLFVLLCFTISGTMAGTFPNQTTSGSSSAVKSKDVEELRKKAIRAGIDSKVIVRLGNGEKLRGRLAEIKDDAITVQYASDTKLESKDLNFSTIADIRRAEGMSTAAKVVVGAGIGAGIALTSLAILAAMLR